MTITTSLVMADNAYGTLGGALATGDTTLTFTTGHGARFPAVASGQVLSCCILNSNNILEEVQITAHTAGADTATMVRGANSTTAKAWNAGDRIEARVSSDVLKRLQVEALKEIVLATGDGGATYTGSISPTGYGLVSGLVYALTAATSNSGTAPTINLSSLGAVTVKLDGGGGLAVGALPKHGLYKYDGTNFLLMNPLGKQPTRTVLTSGSSATYTTPTGATRINVRLVGGGGGGGGATANNGTAGNNTSFGALTGNGGGSGIANQGAAGAGGAASGGDINIPGGGGLGGGTSASAISGGAGGNSAFGGGGPSSPNATGGDGATNSGGGGGGGGGGGANTGGGGGAGGYVEKLITSPSATYTYTVGAAANGGAAGTKAGGNGAAGIIIVDEYYN